MRAYKLFKRRSNGTLGPLFINARQIIPIGETMIAESHPTKGFAVREGWHATLEPIAPHLSMAPRGGCERVWCEVELGGTVLHKRPESQGGTWVLADTLKVIRIMEGYSHE